MALPIFRRLRTLLLVVAPLLLLLAATHSPSHSTNGGPKPLDAPLYFPPTLTPTDIPPTATPELPTATPEPPTATAEPTTNVLPTPRTGPVRVGIQVGHWKSSELPDELARLRTSTGARANGLAEVDINLAVGQRVVALLQQRGIETDLLPATVPPGYEADAVVALHADGSTSARPTRLQAGYALAHLASSPTSAEHDDR